MSDRLKYWLIIISVTAVVSLFSMKGYSHLHDAVINDDIEKVEKLLNLDGSNPNSTLNIGFGEKWTPLFIASYNRNGEMITVLLENGANPNAKDHHGRTPLFYAVELRRKDIAEKFLKGGADPNITENRNWTPLHEAALRGESELVKLLLDHGADSSIKTRHGRTPADLAESNSHTEVITMLKNYKRK
ncbi:MAG: ankyrin repeat domain-containing protein [Planctomycetota bacterium]|jgi:ankyrin repeat protein